jgi:hypothetical protein
MRSAGRQRGPGPEASRTSALEERPARAVVAVSATRICPQPDTAATTPGSMRWHVHLVFQNRYGRCCGRLARHG